MNTALGSDDASLRVGAIRLLPDGDALRVLAGLEDSPQGVVDANAVQRCDRPRSNGWRNSSMRGRSTSRRSAAAREHWSDKMTVASLCKDADRLRQVLARIDDPAVLARLAVEGHRAECVSRPQRPSMTRRSCTRFSSGSAARTRRSTGSSSRSAMRSIADAAQGGGIRSRGHRAVRVARAARRKVRMIPSTLRPLRH